MIPHWRYVFVLELAYVAWRLAQGAVSSTPALREPPENFAALVHHYLSIDARCTSWLDRKKFWREKKTTYRASHPRPTREIYLDVIMPWQITFG